MSRLQWWPLLPLCHSRRQGVVPASSRAISEATSFSSSLNLVGPAGAAGLDCSPSARGGARQERLEEARTTANRAQNRGSWPAPQQRSERRPHNRSVPGLSPELKALIPRGGGEGDGKRLGAR